MILYTRACGLSIGLDEIAGVFWKEITMNFAQRLKNARENAHILQKELSERSGVALRTIQNLSLIHIFTATLCGFPFFTPLYTLTRKVPFPLSVMLAISEHLSWFKIRFAFNISEKLSCILLWANSCVLFQDILNFSCISTTVHPVSYTHLDVYKRQL